MLSKAHVLHKGGEVIDRLISYTAGGGVTMLALLTEAAAFAKELGVILGLALILVRVVHDLLKLYRYWKNK